MLLMNDDPRHPTPQFLAWARLLRSTRELLEQVQQGLADASLPPLEWYDVLLELDLAEDRRLRFFDLGERLLLSRSNLTRLCDRMEKQGLIGREQCAEDRRGLYAVLTPAGAALRARMWPVYRRAVEQCFGTHLSDEEALELAGLLLKARGGHADG